MSMKTHSTSILNGLAEDQRAQVDRWLFQENYGYQEVVEGCQKEFGLTLTLSCVGRYFRREFLRRSRERIVQETAQRQEVLKTLMANPVDNYQMLTRLAGDMAVEEALKPPQERDLR